MKICNSPANTSCMYQRHIARDQADPDGVQSSAGVVQADNGAQSGAASQAYSDLYQHLDGNNDTEALSLLKHLMDVMTDDGATAMDAPDESQGFAPNPPGSGRVQQATDSADLRRRVAVGAEVRRGRRVAEGFLFNKKFPGAARIRNV
jgi:hypothetical protein